MQPKSEESVFQEALKLPTPEERAAFVDAACSDNKELRDRVQELLQAHGEASGFLATELRETVATLPDSDLPDKPGDIIGRYKLLQRIGSGGMGVVYMAEQLEPVKRKVALKIIKLGMDTRQVVARFESERQALALMDHPNIAKVLDAGASETGRPYFVMELVRGSPITEFCDRNKLGLQERLRIFTAVADAIHHAHQKGVIHRDVKPTNILVSNYEGKPIPKVIDFGIAKATQHQLTEKTLFTQFNQLIGTPAYMSPEQAEMSGMDVDTRSDVYSLGIVLYELLVGRPPFEARTLREAGYDEMRRIIREEDPPKPSTKLSTLELGEIGLICDQRASQPDKLGRLVRGELDWIVMKALEKDRSRRYESVSAFARDIERYLNQEPVSAAPPSWSYAAYKFARRHRGALAAAGSIAALLIIGTVVSVRFAVVAGRAEREASKRLASERLALRVAEDAKKEADKSRELAENRMASVFEAQAFRLTEENKIEEAADAIEQAIAIQPKNVAYRDLLARLIGRQIESASWKTHAGEIRSTSRAGQVVEVRRITQEEAGQAVEKVAKLRDKQVDTLRTIIQLSPDRPDVHLTLGMTFLDSDPEAALRIVRSGMQLHPKDLKLILAELKCLAVLGQIDPLISACSRALEAFPEDPALGRVIVAILRRFDAERAIKGYEAILRKVEPLGWNTSFASAKSHKAIWEFSDTSGTIRQGLSGPYQGTQSTNSLILRIPSTSTFTKCDLTLEFAETLLAVGQEDAALEIYRRLYQVRDQLPVEIWAQCTWDVARLHIQHGETAAADPYLDTLEALESPQLVRAILDYRDVYKIAAKLMDNQLEEAKAEFMDLLFSLEAVQRRFQSRPVRFDAMTQNTMSQTTRDIVNALPGLQVRMATADSIVSSLPGLKNAVQAAMTGSHSARLRNEFGLGRVSWRHRMTTPGPGWFGARYDDASWSASLGLYREVAPDRFPGPEYRVEFPVSAWLRHSGSLWARGRFSLRGWRPGVRLCFEANRSVPLKIYLNGVLAAELKDDQTGRTFPYVSCSAEAQATIHPGEQLLAVEAVRQGGNAWFEVHPRVIDPATPLTPTFETFASSLDAEIEKRFEQEQRATSPDPTRLDAFRYLLTRQAFGEKDSEAFNRLAEDPRISPPSVSLVKAAPGFLDLTLSDLPDSDGRRVGTIWEVGSSLGDGNISWTRLVGFGKPRNPSAENEGLQGLMLPVHRFPAGSHLRVRASFEVERLRRSAFGPEISLTLPKLQARTHKLDLTPLFNKDVISTRLDEATDAFDLVDGRLIVNGFEGHPTAAGLPVDGRVGDFQLAPANRLNSLQLTNESQPMVSLKVNLDRVFSVRFLAGAGNGSAHAYIVFVYDDGTEEKRLLFVNDWFDDPPAKGLETATGESLWYASRAVIDAMNRYSNGTFDESKDAALFECAVPVDSRKRLREIQIHPGARRIEHRLRNSQGMEFDIGFGQGIVNILAINVDQLTDPEP